MVILYRKVDIFCFMANDHIDKNIIAIWLHLYICFDRGFEPQWGQTKDYKIGICCFSAKRSALGGKSKDWLARNQNNVSEWSDMSTRGLLLKHYKNPCWFSTKRTSSSSHYTLICSRHDIAKKIAELALNNNHSLIYLLV